MFKLVSALLAALSVVGSTHAQDHAKLIPSNVAAFVSVNPQKLWKAQALKSFHETFRRLDLAMPDIGLEYTNIARMTLFWPVAPMDVRESEPFILVSTIEPFNEAKLFKAIRAVPADQVEHFPGHMGYDPIEDAPSIVTSPATEATAEATSKPVKDKKDSEQPPATIVQETAVEVAPIPTETPELYFAGDQTTALLRIDAKTLLFMPGRPSQRATLTLLGQLFNKNDNGPLAEALKELPQHDVVATTQLQPLMESMEPSWMQQEAVAYQALLQAEQVVKTIDFGETTTITARFTFANAVDAARAKPVAAAGLKEIQEQYQLVSKTLFGTEEKLNAMTQPLFSVVIEMLKDATLTTTDNVLSVTMTGKFGPALTEFSALAPTLIENSANSSKASNNFKMCALALHSFESENAHFPNDISDANGKLLLSWRVQILPYLDQSKLYEQIDMTKSWDDPVNKKLWDKMPKLFEIPGRDAEPGMTYVQMPTSEKGFAFKMPGFERRIVSVSDGTSNTIMTVEAQEAVNWMKPDDVAFDGKTVPKFGDPKGTKFNVGLADGSVKTLKQSIKPETLKALITPSGGEVFNLDD